MRIVAISDTHGNHPTDLPDGDVLIHCGDATNFGDPHELNVFAQWLREQPHRHKLVVPGNHDLLFEEDLSAAMTFMPDDVEVLIDQLLYIDGVGFYGAPWTPRFGDWAFMYHSRDKDPWIDGAPADVLITHGPRHGVLDKNLFGEECGDVLLANYCARVAPKLHVFGHIHEAPGEVERTYLLAGSLETRKTLHANVARAGNRLRPYFVYDLE